MSRYRYPLDIWDKLTIQYLNFKEFFYLENSKNLVLEGPILQYDKDKNRIIDRYLFLVGNLLIITKQKKDKFKPKYFIGLTTKKCVSAVNDSEYKIPDVEFRVYGWKTYIFFAKNKNERDMWVSAMEKYV